jgi:hypothetical protein
MSNAHKQFYKETPFGLGSIFDLAVMVGGPKHAPNAERHSSKRSLPSMSRGSKRFKNEEIVEAKVDEFGDMTDDDMGEPVEVMALKSSGAGEGYGKQIKETAITRAPPTYALQDTHTTIIPVLYSCSMCGQDFDAPLRLQIRGTNPLEPLAFSPSIQVPAVGTTITKGWWTALTFNASLFPADPPADGRNGMLPFNSAPQAAGWNYWNKIYEYYTVLDMYYDVKVFFMHEDGLGSTGVEVGQFEESFKTSDSNGKTPALSLHRAKHMEKIKWSSHVGKRTGSSDPAYITFSGHYWPGKAETNVRNDEDVKTWNLVSTQPSLQEQVVLDFYKLPFFVNSTGIPANARQNLVIEVKYVVQFKDRIPAYKFPGNTVTPVTTSSASFYI